MRALAGLGAVVFLYLALIPGGLIYSTLDSACAGEGCESSLGSRIAFTAIYGVCLVAVLGTAALFANYALTGALSAEARLSRAMALTGAVIGAALFVLFTVAFPIGGAIALLLAAVGYLTVRLLRERSGEDAPGDSIDPTTNGHHSGNGHRSEALRGTARPPR